MTNTTMYTVQFNVSSDTGVQWQVKCKRVPHLHAYGFTVADALDNAVTSLRDLASRAAQDQLLGREPGTVFRPLPEDRHLKRCEDRFADLTRAAYERDTPIDHRMAMLTAECGAYLLDVIRHTGAHN